MSKKDFSNVNTGRVYTTIAEATAEQETQPKRKDRKTYTEQEAAEFLHDMRTTGHKGVKLPRINVAFAPDVYEYISTMSRVRGESMTTFINTVLRSYMQEHMDVYEKAIEFKNSL